MVMASEDDDMALSLAISNSLQGIQGVAGDQDGFDLAVARSLQDKYDKEVFSHHQKDPTLSLPVPHTKSKTTHSERKSDMSIVSREMELQDPNPDIHQLFVEFDAMFFWGKLVAGGVAVSWSDRMTLCAGVCSYEGRGGFCSIRLSKSLLKFRPRRDLVETLLHEMIHAYLFVTHNNKDHDGHGPQFQSHMKRINEKAGTNITIYHNFHQEVKQYQQHWWKCNGPCQRRPPYYGMVKRAMNRAPSSRDLWWADHQRTCGGTFTKIKEPEGYGKKGKNNGSKMSSGSKVGSGNKLGKVVSSGIRDLRKMLGGKAGGSSSSKSSSSVESDENGGADSAEKKDVAEMRRKMLEAAERRRMQSRGQKRAKNEESSPKSSKKPRIDDEKCIIIDDSPAPAQSKMTSSESESGTIQDRKTPTPEVIDLDDDDQQAKEDWLKDMDDFKTCPVCGVGIPAPIINLHVSLCLDADEQAQIIDDD